MRVSGYGYGTRLKGVSLEEARSRVADELAKEGFGILTEIDVKATLKKKLEVDFRPYLILGACNPTLAHRALGAEPQIGLLLPCNVVIQQEGEDVTVSIADPHAMFSLVNNPELQPVVEEADRRLRRVLDALGR